MPDNNGGMNMVWVMSEDDKQRASVAAVVLVLLIGVVVGGMWLHSHFLPSIEQRLTQAQSNKYDLQRTLQALDSDVTGLESASETLTKGQTTTANLEWFASNLRRSKEHISKGEGLRKEIDRQVPHLKSSDQVEMRVSGLALERFAGEARSKLEALQARIEKATAAVSDRLPKQ